MASAYVKIQIGTDLRRIALKKGDDLPTFKKSVLGLYETAPPNASLKTMIIKYRDSDGDLITLGSTEEFQLFVEEVFGKKEAQQQRLFVSFESQAEEKPEEAASEDASSAASAPPPAPPMHPAQVIANALSDPEAVRSLQNAVASPVLNDAVIQVAQGFSTAGPFGAWAAVAQAVPTARAVFEEAMDNNPTLCEARKKLLEAGIDVNDFGSCWAQFAGGRHGCHRCGPGRHHGPHHHPHHHRGPHHQPQAPGGHLGLHPWVVCDGCSDHSDLKAQSVREGFHSPRGWICGIRYKSTSVDDFDLCHSCKCTGRFDASHGPFELIQVRRPWGFGAAGSSHSGGCAPQASHHHQPRGGCGPCEPHQQHHGSSPHCQAQQQQQQPEQPHHPWTGANFFGFPPFHPQQHQAPRGCRGSRRDLFTSVFRDIVTEGASAVERAAKENDNEPLASLARAFTESFRAPSTNSGGAAASSTNNANSSAPAAPQQAKTDESQPQQPVAPVDEAPKESTAHQVDSESEWEVPDVSPVQSEDPFVKWQAALERLASLGFTESENYVEFLEEEKGDLERVVNRIVRRAA